MKDRRFLFCFFAVWAVSVYATAVAARVVLHDFHPVNLTLVQYFFPLANFDSGYYFSIAQHGYTGSVEAARAFFPLFPLLLALCGGLFWWLPSVWQLPVTATV